MMLRSRCVQLVIACVVVASGFPAAAAVECFDTVEIALGGFFFPIIAAADVDGDGDQDFLMSAGDLAWYDNDGGSPPAFTEVPIPSALNSSRPFPADMDGDGDLDVVSDADSGLAGHWFDNDGAPEPTFTEHSIPSIEADDTVTNLADVNGDGRLDILTMNAARDQILWQENDGGSPPTFISHAIDVAVPLVTSLAAADLDADGDQDIVAAYDNDDAVVWHENLGGSPPTFVQRFVDTDSPEAFDLVGADVDGDGDVDILAHEGSDLIRYESDGGSPPTFTKVDRFARVSDAVDNLPVDLDGDGDLDILVPAFGQGFNSRGSVFWLENEGGLPPVYRSRLVSTLRIDSPSADTADFDGDGDLDVLASWQDRISWFEHTSAPTDALELGHTPLVRGETASFDVRFIEADEPVTVYYSTTGEGSGPCGPQLGGLCLDILAPIRALGTTTGFPGCGARLSVDVPGNVPFAEVSTQAVVDRGPDSIKSNAITAPIEEP